MKSWGKMPMMAAASDLPLLSRRSRHWMAQSIICSANLASWVIDALDGINTEIHFSESSCIDARHRHRGGNCVGTSAAEGVVITPTVWGAVGLLGPTTLFLHVGHF